VDLGYAYDTTWRFLGFYRTSTGIQFCRWDMSQPRYGLQHENLGAEVTTNIPAANLFPIGVGLINASAAARNLDIDWWGAGGTIPR
jgi:hypothetical protein